APGVPQRAEPFVLVAQDLAPADAATLDPAQVLAVVTVDGGPTSHTAILTRALGIPAVVAVRELLTAVREGDQLLVDGRTGVVTRPPGAARGEAGLGVGRRPGRVEGPGAAAGGHRVLLMANLGGERGGGQAVGGGAEGGGLFRTELCFLD